jgi:hypothetical protein
MISQAKYFFRAPAGEEHDFVNDPSVIARALDKSEPRTAENAAGV